MSIIEQALEKGRAAQQQRSKSRRAPEADSARAIERRERAAAIDPSTRLLALSVSVDPRGCRDSRVLLGDTSDGDAAATAAYRILRTRLLHRARTERWTTIAVTSACANDGKTLTAINLALSMAREKSREIVLLDLDMRNPSVCRVLGVHPPYDLGVHLEKGEGERELFFSIGSDNLLIAGSDAPRPRASELLSSSRFDDLLGMIRTGTVNPVILIDLPPVLLTDDALVVAPKVDAVLVVASQGVTGRADLSKALNLLSEFPIAGVVLNRADDAGPGYEYAYYQESAARASVTDS
jgi:Mrp family chromosome partitioning ATPase